MNFSSLRAGSGRSFRRAEPKQRSSSCKTRSVRTCASGPSGAGQPTSLRELAATVATTATALAAVGTVCAPLVGLFFKVDSVDKRLDNVDKHLDNVDKRLDRLENRMDRLENRLEEMQSTLHKICGKLGI